MILSTSRLTLDAANTASQSKCGAIANENSLGDKNMVFHILDNTKYSLGGPWLPCINVALVFKLHGFMPGSKYI
jgi:hypothetical protein